MCVGLPATYAILLSDFKETWIFSTALRKLLRYIISWASVQWEPSCCVRTDRHDEAISRVSQFFRGGPTNLDYCTKKRPGKNKETQTRTDTTKPSAAFRNFSGAGLQTWITAQRNGLERIKKRKCGQTLRSHQSLFAIFPGRANKLGLLHKETAWKE
jgi:hypothetical protein